MPSEMFAARIEISPVKDESDYLPLIRVPLRELSADQLWGYTYSVFYTVGGADDFFYFLPRILELSSAPFSPFDNEVVFKKVALSGWPGEWLGKRRLAFESYLQALVASWQEIELDIDSWVCALSFCVSDLPSQLDSLLSGKPAATANLIHFYESNSRYLPTGQLGNAFWEKSEKAYMGVLQWLRREDVSCSIQNAYRMTESGD